MTNQSNEAGQRLRPIAEQKAALMPEIPDALSPQEVCKVLHELRVHQIELEMQNEELRRIQTELETSRARYFDLYDLAPVGYVTISEEGLILEANLTAATMLGVTRDELVKWPFSRFIHPEDQDSYYRLRTQLITTGEPHCCEALRLLRKDAAPFWARYESVLAHDADGATVCRVVISDITERKQAEEELRRVQKLLLAANCELEHAVKLEQQLARTDELTGLNNHRFLGRSSEGQ